MDTLTQVKNLCNEPNHKSEYVVVHWLDVFGGSRSLQKKNRGLEVLTLKYFFLLCCLAKGSNHFYEQTEHHSNTNQRGDDANANEQCLLSRAGGETPVGEDQTLFILQELPESEEIAHITVVEELGSLCYGGPMNVKL